MTTWFTSDSHFNHARILELGQGRPFDSIQQHDEALIRNWNAVVQPEDTVWHLGDVALGMWPLGLDRVSRLNGHKILVPGNHDRISSVEKLARRERFREDYARVFDEIADEVCDIELFGRKVMLSHYPYSGDSHGSDRFADFRAVDNGVPLIHGHNHCGPKKAHSVSLRGTPQLAVGVDAWNFTPVHENIVKEWLDTHCAPTVE